jgi:hypothetical protein
MTPGPGPLPVAASVLFLRMHAFADAEAPERASRREQLQAVLEAALPAWDEERRVVLEAPDGLAVVGDVEPSKALAAAQLAADHGADGSVGIALHHGPVRVVVDNEGETRVVGDGVDTAGSLAGFHTGHPVVVSQAFRAALSARAPRLAQDLRPAGEQVDERLRPHALFVFDPAPAKAVAQRRRVIALAGLCGLLVAGWSVRIARERYAEAHRPATLVLDIRPSGEVFVDGAGKGTAPPLTRLSVPPGRHTIEVRNGRMKPVHMEVQLQPGEELQVKHVFVAPPVRRARPPAPRREQQHPGVLDRFKFW